MISIIKAMNIEQQNLINSQNEIIRVQELHHELIRIMPCLILFFFLYVSLNSFLALIIYEIYLFGMPVIYLKFINPSPIKSYYSRLFLQNWKNQLIFGILLCFLFFGVSFSLFQWTFAYRSIYWISYEFYIPRVNAIYILIFLIMVFLDPILSEIYWRSIILDTSKRPKRFRMCFYYGVFHSLIVYLIKDSINAVISLVIFMVFGWMFTILKEKIGIITSALAHMGLNMSYCLAVILIIREKSRLFD